MRRLNIYFEFIVLMWVVHGGGRWFVFKAGRVPNDLSFSYFFLFFELIIIFCFVSNVSCCDAPPPPPPPRRDGNGTGMPSHGFFSRRRPKGKSQLRYHATTDIDSSDNTDVTINQRDIKRRMSRPETAIVSGFPFRFCMETIHLARCDCFSLFFVFFVFCIFFFFSGKGRGNN